MGEVLALDDLMLSRQVWRGRRESLPLSQESTGHAALDAALPLGGWPEKSLTEILLPADGVGELDLLIPIMERFAQAEGLYLSALLRIDSIFSETRRPTNHW